MTERITTDDVAKVAKLARLRLTDDELDRFTGQLAERARARRRPRRRSTWTAWSRWHTRCR